MPNIHITNDTSGPTMRLEDGTPILKDFDFRCGLWENMFNGNPPPGAVIHALYHFDSYPADAIRCLEHFGTDGVLREIIENLLDTDVTTLLPEGIRSDSDLAVLRSRKEGSLSVIHNSVEAVLKRHYHETCDGAETIRSALEAYAKYAEGDFHTCLYHIWRTLGCGCAGDDAMRALWYEPWRTRSIEKIYGKPIQSPADDYGDIDAIRFDEAMTRIFEVALDVTRRMRSSKQEAKEAK